MIRKAAWGGLILAALAFLLAIVFATQGRRFLGVEPEGYSRACTNLALLTIAMLMVDKRAG